MKKLVINDLEILDKEKYTDNIRSIYYIGSLFDFPDDEHINTDWQLDYLDSPIRFKFSDITDEEWKNIPREYELEIISFDSLIIKKECFEQEIDWKNRISQILDEYLPGYVQVRLNYKMKNEELNKRINRPILMRYKMNCSHFNENNEL